MATIKRLLSKIKTRPTSKDIKAQDTATGKKHRVNGTPNVVAQIQKKSPTLTPAPETPASDVGSATDDYLTQEEEGQENLLEREIAEQKRREAYDKVRYYLRHLLRCLI